MKYKLSKKQIDELSQAKFDHPWLRGRGAHTQTSGSHHKVFDIELEPIIQALPKPTIRNVEDLKALEGWELESKMYPQGEWYSLDHKFVFERCYEISYKIRQIDLPSNSFLVSDCIEEIEESIEVGDLVEWLKWNNKSTHKRYGIVQEIVSYQLRLDCDILFGGINTHKLIRKAKDITQADRVKYLGEEPMEIEVTDGTLAK